MYGHPVVVDGALWNVKVSADGSEVTAEPYAGPMGKVHINHPAWRAFFIRSDMMLRVTGGPEPVLLPEGRFELAQLEEWLTPDATKPRPSLKTDRTKELDNTVDFINVRQGQTTEVAIGSPIVVWVTAAQEGSTVHFTIHEADVTGRRPVYPLSERASAALPPTITIYDSSGRAVAAWKPKWIAGNKPAEWQVPPGTRGTFTATVDYDACGFAVQPKKTTFSIK
jgi:hypothetical protein